MAGLLLGVVLFGVASFVVASAPALAQSAGPQIVVEGNRRVEAETIRSYFKVPPGERLDAARIDLALKALYSSGLFQDIRISQSGGRLIVTVVEAPVIDRIAFEGNSKLKDEQLQQEIQSKPRGTLSRAAVQADVTRIIEVYHRNGRFDVQVVPKIVERPNNRVDLVFEIREGEKTGVRSIIFVGNHAYSDYRLKEVIKTSTSNFLSFLQTTDVYDTDRIEADRDLIRRFYLTHGYADVQVVSATGEYDPAIKGFIITFTIEEGALYHFGNVEVQSNIRAVDPVALQHVLRMHRGDIYNGDSVEKTVEDVTVEITKHGYPFATVRPRGDRDPQNHLINVVFVVDEGVRAYIERINIRGNTRTRDYVIRREFDISEGDPYNRALIDRAERRIKNSEFLQDREDHQRARFGARPGGDQRRRRRAIDRRFLGHGRLFHRRRLHGAGLDLRAQPPGNGPLRQSLGHLWAIYPRHRARLRRTLLPRPAPLRRRRSVRTPDIVEPVSFIRQHELRDQSENGRAATRGSVAAGALFDLLDPDQLGFELGQL